MPYKSFPFDSALAAPDVQNYLMNQMIVTCTSATRPPAPPHGMVIYETDTFNYWYCSNASGPVWAPWISRVDYSPGNTAVSTTTTTFLGDIGISAIGFTNEFPDTVYRITYVARAQSTTANDTTIAVRIQDGGVNPPTSASPILAQASCLLRLTGSAGGTQIVCRALTTLSAGSHFIGVFYGRIGGTGSVQVSQTTGQFRHLSIEHLPIFHT